MVGGYVNLCLIPGPISINGVNANPRCMGYVYVIVWTTVFGLICIFLYSVYKFGTNLQLKPEFMEWHITGAWSIFTFSLLFYEKFPSLSTEIVFITISKRFGPIYLIENLPNECALENSRINGVSDSILFFGCRYFIIVPFKLSEF